MRYTLSRLMISLAVMINVAIAEPGAQGSSEKKETKATRAQTLSPALQQLNASMHLALGQAVALERRALGPLIMFEAGEIKLYRGDQEVAGYPIDPPLNYHRLKVIGHAAFGVIIQLRRTDLSDEERAAWLTKTAKALRSVASELGDYGLPREVERSQRTMIEATLKIIEATKRGAPPTADALQAFADRVLPQMKVGFSYSARAHIDLIHAQAKKLYALLTPEERATVRGYFYGGRGARVGNLALQYISWFVGEHTGQESERVVFTEGVFEHRKAMDALAKFTVERKLARLVFGDPAGLHRDVLSEATREYLATFPKASDAFSSD